MMDDQQIVNDGTNQDDVNSEEHKTSAVNSLILEYYKKFGKKRDLEQFFSLSTAQSEIRDPSSLFWKKIKALSDSSDSGDKRSESSTELCKISIRCSVPDNSSKLQKEAKMSDADSPPIITEVHEYRHSDNESVKSEDVHSLKSVDGTLDLSMNKPHSPTSSVTSQRRLEWDSLADVGYGNESDQKMSASSLSTLERLALQQQYCINDTHQSNLGLPTAHSTPLEPNIGVNKSSKSKKDLSKNTTKISSKEVDFIEMTLPQIPETKQAINLNLTKHITFNVDKKGEVKIEKISKNVSSSPEKVSVGTYIIPEVKFDKEIQTTLIKKKSQDHEDYRKNPVCVNLNTLKKRNRKKKLRKVKSKSRLFKEIKVLNKSIVKDKSGEQISAAESFEYMPGHIYNQTHINNNNEVKRSIPKKDNKSSLESSTGHTTDSSKDKNSFSKDLEKSIDLLKITLKRGNADDEIKKKLIKEIVQRLLKTRYKDDDSSDFLSGLSFDSKKLDLGGTSTSSTSDGREYKPKKSILRVEKFNSDLPSTSQSTPNLPSTIKCEVAKAHGASNTDSDQSKDAKTSSEELYQKYIKALKREQAYKEHLKIKEALLKQKLVGSDTKINQDVKSQNRIKDLMKDLVRNNYDDGSGDASKLEGGSLNNINLNQSNSIRKHKSHSVFTLSSGTSSQQKTNTKKTDIGTTTSRSSKNENHYCCCPLHIHKVGVTDSSVQVNILSSNEMHTDFHRHKHKCDKCSDQTNSSANIENNIKRNEIKYVCLCKETNSQGVPDNILIYKCSQLDTDHKSKNMSQQSPHCTNTQCSNKEVSRINQKVLETSTSREQNFQKQSLNIQESSSSKSSQTNLDLDVILLQKYSDKCGSSTSTGQDPLKIEIHPKTKSPMLKFKKIHEAIRWTQTDISINPKISDPSFSDINIIDKKDCAKLVSEQCKEVSLENIKTSSDEMTELITDSSSKGLNRNSSTKLGPDDEFKKADKQIQSDIDIGPVYNIGSQRDLQKKLNYSIPIEGTNMTLKVSLGDRETPDINAQSNLYNRPILKTKETLTHKPTTSGNSTCLLQECSVGVQSTENNLIDEYYNQAAACACKEVLKTRDKESKSEISTQIHILDKYHTYPKGDKPNPLKPLLRSNTDTSRLEKASHVTFDKLKINFDKGPAINSKTENMIDSQKVTQDINFTSSSEKTSENCKESQSSKTISDSECQTKSKSSSTSRDAIDVDEINDPLIDLIQNITKRYSKKDTQKSKRKKCFKEIITVLNYLLDTEESSDQRVSTENTESINRKESQKKEFTDKAVQLSNSKKDIELPDPTSSDLPTTSTDSTACHVLNKIKKECEKYQQKRCKSHHRKVEESSSTSMNCHHRREHCYCKGYKCKHKQFEKNKKKSLAYNLIVQSDSLASEETICQNNNRPLRNIIVKVPKKKYENMPLKEMCAKLEREIPHCSRVYRSKSLPNDSEVSSTEDVIRQTQAFSVREYLERNRPDFVEKCYQRQNCLKMINETSGSKDTSPRMNMIIVHTPKCNTNPCIRKCTMYCRGGCTNCNNSINQYKNQQCVQNGMSRVANERAAKRKLLSMQVGQQQTLSEMSDAGLKVFAAQLGKQLRTKKLAPKFISERDMKRHSEKIYKTLPEVVNKKEQMKKECVKKTNLLLASIFKKNLQKKTLQGAVNLSNYSTIIKI